MKSFWLIVLSVSVFLSSEALCRQIRGIDKDKLIQMAKSGMLSGKSPADIRLLFQQAGISEEEMLRYGREQNIDFTQFLQEKAQAVGAATPTVTAAAETVKVPVSLPAARRPIVSMPSFSDRPDAKNLRPFGYDIFQNAPSTFEPVANAPTPVSYRVGAGDNLIITVWGQTQLTYQLTVARDGYIMIPDVGKVQVGGQTIDQVKSRLIGRLSQVYEGLKGGRPNANTFLDVSLGNVRTIQVFVLGNAQTPGGYSLNGFSTAFTALYYAGGPSAEGSLREVRVVHSNTQVDTVDFYDYILFGKKSGDVRLQDGDAIFIPPAGLRVAITGAINQPAIYELKTGETLHDLLSMAGGIQYTAYTRRVHIERIVPFTQRAKYQKDVLDLDVEFKDADELLSSNISLEAGDIVYILGLGRERENLVTLSGSVWKPGRYELVPNMRVRDLISKADGFREDTFLDRATIVRTLPDLKQEILSFNPRLAMEADTAENILLQRLDEVVIYNEDFFRPTHNVSIDGAVRSPGSYTRKEHLTVRDLILLAGGVLEGADLQNIDVSRIDTLTKEQISRTYHVSLPTDYWNFSGANDFELMDFDHVSIRFKPEFSLLKKVAVTGEAQYAGTYSILYEGERIASLIKRFGGFKPSAYLSGIRLRRTEGFDIYRPSPEIVETQQIDTLALRYNFVKKPRLATNEVPIDVEQILKDTTSVDNLVIQNGDVLVIPRDPGVVYVEGQVYVPSSVPYKKGASLDYYISQAGGFNTDADEDNTVVVLPNGRKWEKGGFLSSASEILSGSTIITPLRINEASNTLEILRDWVSIVTGTTTMVFIVWQVSK